MSVRSTRRVEYAIFDMDGLLTSDSEPGHLDRSHHLLQKYGYTKPYSWEYKAQTMGRPPRQSAEKMFSFYSGLEDKISITDWIAQRSILHEQAFKRVKLLKGALELVKGLNDAEVPIAIATGSNNANFRWKTDHLPELFGLFPPERVFTADSNVGKGKPAPDIYLAAARGLGQDVGTPESATAEQLANRAKGLVFEDAVLVSILLMIAEMADEKGVNAGVAAGMNVVWVPHPDLWKMYPDETFGSAEILDSLEDFEPESWGLPSL